MEDFIWNVKYYYTKLIKSPIRDIFEGIKNIFRWMPLVWRDRDWDYIFILYVMEFKLKNTSKCLEESRFKSVNADKYIKNLNIASHLIKRLREDNYNENQINKYDGADQMFDEILNKKYTWSKGLKKEYEKRAKLREYDKEMFGKIFKKHLDSWWD